MSHERAAKTRSSSDKVRRSPIKQVVVCGVIVGLLGVFGWESWQRWGYSRTLSQLQEALRKSESERRALPLATARSLTSGAPADSESSENGAKVVSLRWRSLYEDYRIRLQISQQDEVLQLVTGGDQMAAVNLSPFAVTPPYDSSWLHNPRTTELSALNIGLSKTSPRAVLLDTVESGPFADNIDSGILIRELGRQAFLIAARESLSLPTRDRTLGDEFFQADSPAILPLGVITTIGTDGQAHVTIFRRKPPQDREFEKLLSIKVPLEGADRISSVTAVMEPLSRGQFVEILRAAGFGGEPGKYSASEQVSSEIEKLRESIDMFSQFAAIRLLHAEIREHGESLPRLAALSQAYALLGTLTETHWSPAHKAFKARALLYAERMFAREPKDISGPWTRAYVRALVGLPDAALKDLETAKSLNGDQGAPPVWVPLITAFCRGDRGQLRGAADNGPEPILAAYLEMLSADIDDSPQQRIQAAMRFDKAVNGSSRAWEVMERDSPLGVSRAVAERGMVGFPQELSRRLSTIPGLPPKLLQLIPQAGDDENDEPTNRERLMHGLRDAGALEVDSGEPSWAALSQLILEGSFVTAWRMVNFERNMLGVKADDTLEHLLPMLESHSYAPLLEMQRSDHEAASESRSDLSYRLESTRLELTEIDAIAAVESPAPGNENSRQKIALHHADSVLRDLVAQVRLGVSESGKQAAAKRLRNVASQLPVAAAASIGHDWDAVSGKADEWETLYSDNVSVLASLAIRYRLLDRFGDAERCLRKQLKVMPEVPVYVAIADILKEQNKEEEWKETLEEALKLPSLGLEHAEVHLQLARHYMARKDWKQAQPHAEEAAESYSAFGLICAAECFEGQRKWEEAERLHQAVSMRYEQAALDWYQWCQATGHGDLNAARAKAESHFDEVQRYGDSESLATAGAYLRMEGRLGEAFRAYESGSQNLKDAYNGLHAALVADELGQPELRDQFLKACFAPPGNNDAITAELALYFHQTLAAGAQGKLDPATVEWIVRRADSVGTATDLLYFVGKFLALRGANDEAKTYFERAARSTARNKANRYLAGFELVQAGHEPPPPRQPVFEGPLDLAFRISVRGSQAYNEGRKPRAQELYSQALQTSPQAGEALLYRSRLATEMEQPADALADLDRLVQLLPSIPFVFVERGRVHEEMGNQAAAIADYEAALKLDDTYPVAHNNIGWLYASCVDPAFRDGEKSLAHARKTERPEIWPRSKSLSLIGAAYARLGQFDEAVRNTREALDNVTPEQAEALRRRMQLFKEGRPYERQADWWRPSSKK